MPDPNTKTTTALQPQAITPATGRRPRIRQPWLRLLLFIVTFILIGLLSAILAIIFLLGTGVGDLQNNATQPLPGLIAGNYLGLIVGLELITSIISICIFRLLIERRKFLPEE